MKACACGGYHTITLSGDGIVYSFGRNAHGQLGLGHNNDVSLPTPIPNLPKINLISCGKHFAVCVDHEGFIWSFGDNSYGQLGTGNTTNFNAPQKIINIPPVLSVSCGYEHTLIITNDDNLWSCGRNTAGQLCHGDTEDRSKPQQTSFPNILKIITFQKYQLVLIIHYFKTTKEKYFHAVIINTEHVDWGIVKLFKSHQVSFAVRHQTLFNLFVEITRNK